MSTRGKRIGGLTGLICAWLAFVAGSAAIAASSLALTHSLTLTGQESCGPSGVPQVVWTLTNTSTDGSGLVIAEATTAVIHANGTSATLPTPSPAGFSRFVQLNPGESVSAATPAAAGDRQTENVVGGFMPSELGTGIGTATVSVGPCPTTTAIAVAPGTTLTTGTQVTYTATVTPTPDGGTVAFTDGGRPIPGCGSADVNAATGTATCTTTYATPGTHTVTAAYSGTSAFAASTSGTVTVTVASPPPPRLPPRSRWRPAPHSPPAPRSPTPLPLP
jgi:hypothetical protein